MQLVTRNLRKSGLIACLLLLTLGSQAWSEQPITLEMWSHWQGEAVKMRFVEEIITEFEALHPDIRVHLRWIPKNRIYQSLSGLLPKGMGPDIFYADPFPAQLVRWMDKGYVLNIENSFDWNRFEPHSYDGLRNSSATGIYGVPIELAEYAIYYNKKLFAQAGIRIPQRGKFTANEFFEAVKTLRAHHIIPLAAGNQDRGIVSNLLFHGLLLRFAGIEKLQGLKTGRTSWRDENITAAFRYMKQLIDVGVFPKEMNRLSYAEGRALFVDGEAAMTTEGTWFFGKLADAEGHLPPHLEQWLGAMDYPAVPNGKGNQATERMTGGCYLIRESSSHTKEAVQFLQFMTSEHNGRKWIQYTQSPFGVRIDFKEQLSLPFLKELFNSRLDVREYLVPGVASMFDQATMQIWMRDVGQVFMGGGISVEEVLQRLEYATESDVNL